MKIAFLTEMGFEGIVPSNHSNMRTEFAWMHALGAYHHNIHNYREVSNYDHVFVIFPKGKTYLNSEGSRLVNQPNPISTLLTANLVDDLKKRNQKVHYVQEGPHWWFNDYELSDQIGFYNMLASCSSIFAHNESDVKYYKGLLPNIPVHTMPSLMIESTIEGLQPQPKNRVIIGGNFARWYGGFESYIVALQFGYPIWGQTSHAKRDGEDQIVQLLPRVLWTDWMKQLSEFKYAVHLMPTVAAGTFSLNCAYLGIPCIGNREVDTQKLCHPNLAVDVHDVERAVELARQLRNDADFYNECSEQAKKNYQLFYSLNAWKDRVAEFLT